MQTQLGSARVNSDIWPFTLSKDATYVITGISDIFALGIVYVLRKRF